MHSKIVYASIFAISIFESSITKAQTKSQNIPAIVLEDVERIPLPRATPKPPTVKTKWREKFKASRFVFQGIVKKIEYEQAVAADKSIWPITYVTFDSVDFWKGKSSSSELTIAFPFGQLPDGSVLMMSGVPIFQVGDSQVLFLQKNGDELNPVDDESILFYHKGNVFTPESNPLLTSLDQDVLLGKEEKIDSILNKNTEIEGMVLRVEASSIGEQDEKGLVRVTESDFKKIVTSEQSIEADTFKETFVGAFSKLEYAGSPVVNPEIKAKK